MTNAYWVDAGEHLVTVDDLGELGSIDEYSRVCSIVYADTRAQAKYLFIQFHSQRESYTRVFLEWNDVKSIRLLARDVSAEPRAANCYPDKSWKKATLTPFGVTMIQDGY